MYNEIKYWRNRKYPNSVLTVNPPPIEELNYFSYIKKHLSGCSSVLDFGPGVGRTFIAYDSLKKLECFDITDKHLTTLNDAARRYNFKFKFTLGNKIGVTPYKDKKFEAAISCQVFLHQKPDKIKKVMSELLRIADKVIVISWSQKGSVVTDAPHCFNYNYMDICRKNGWKVLDVKYKPKNNPMYIYFVYKENN